MIGTCTGVLIGMLIGIRGIAKAKWHHHWKNNELYRRKTMWKEAAQGGWKVSGALQKPIGITIEETMNSTEEKQCDRKLHRGAERYQGHCKSQMASPLKKQWTLQKKNNMIETCTVVLKGIVHCKNQMASPLKEQWALQKTDNMVKTAWPCVKPP